jgi:hypothetical protein
MSRCEKRFGTRQEGSGFLSLLLLLMCSCCPQIVAQGQLVERGTVRDATTNLPITCARVSAVGSQAKAPDCTDNKGQFDISLSPLIKAGDQIRIRVEKDGYLPADVKEAASSEVIVQIAMSPVPAPAKHIVTSPLPHVVQVLRATDDDGMTEFEINLRQDHPIHVDIVRLTVEGDFFARIVCDSLADRTYLYTFGDTLSVLSRNGGNVAGEATSHDNPRYAYPVMGHISTTVCPATTRHLSLTTNVAIPVHSEYATIALRFPAKFHITDGVVKETRRPSSYVDPGVTVSDTDTSPIPQEDFEEISVSSFTNFTFTFSTALPNEGTIIARYPFASKQRK